MLMAGQCSLFLCSLKTRIPFLPKCPGWYLNILILRWCSPPAYPLPEGCFLCFPTLPCPWETCPLNLRVFFNREVMLYKLSLVLIMFNLRMNRHMLSPSKSSVYFYKDSYFRYGNNTLTIRGPKIMTELPPVHTSKSFLEAKLK